MKQKIDPNKPIHPTGHSQSGTGMTLRQYYAGQAMMGLAAEYSCADVSTNSCAAHAVALADALITELNKETE